MLFRVCRPIDGATACQIVKLRNPSSDSALLLPNSQSQRLFRKPVPDGVLETVLNEDVPAQVRCASRISRCVLLHSWLNANGQVENDFSAFDPLETEA
jgi:hypothetical protein